MLKLYCLSIVLGVISVIMTKTGEGKLLILAIALIFAVFIALSAMLYGKQHYHSAEDGASDTKEDTK